MDERDIRLAPRSRTFSSGFGASTYRMRIRSCSNVSDLDLSACAESTVIDDDVGAILDCLQRRWFTGLQPNDLVSHPLRCRALSRQRTGDRLSVFSRVQPSGSDNGLVITTVADWKWVVITSLPGLRSWQTEPFSSAGLQHRADVQPSSDRVRRRLAVILGDSNSPTIRHPIPMGLSLRHLAL